MVVRVLRTCRVHNPARFACFRIQTDTHTHISMTTCLDIQQYTCEIWKWTLTRLKTFAIDGLSPLERLSQGFWAPVRQNGSPQACGEVIT